MVRVGFVAWQIELRRFAASSQQSMAQSPKLADVGRSRKREVAGVGHLKRNWSHLAVSEIAQNAYEEPSTLAFCCFDDPIERV